jgi:imidazolonepropionase-like amidohydrolase
MRILFIALAFSLSIPTFAQKVNYDLVINNVNLVDVNTGKTTPATNVYIKNGVAEITNKMKKIAEPEMQIDGTGKYFMPALYDMHVHFPDNNAVRFFNLQTAAGITNCRIMKSNEYTLNFAGRIDISNNIKKDTIRRRGGNLRRDAEEEKRKRFMPAMKISYNFFGDETYKLDSIPIIIKSLKAKGYDFIKVFGVKDEAHFDAIMAAAKAENIMVCGHALGKVPAKKLLASGYKSIEHLGYFDKAKTLEALDTLIELAVKNNVFICPTFDWEMMAYHASSKDSFQYRAGYEIGKKLYANIWDTTYENATKQFGKNLKYYSDYANSDVSKKIAILTKMRAKGVKIIAGSDAEEPYQTPGFSLLDELKQIQKAGFTNAELLQMVTTNGDLFWNKKTKQTDYILLSKNPLDNINNLGTVEYVLKGSEVIDTKKLLESIE